MHNNFRFLKHKESRGLLNGQPTEPIHVNYMGTFFCKINFLEKNIT